MLKNSRLKRQKRIRKKIFGKNDHPRLSVFRSGKHIYGQVIDDVKMQTLLSESDLKIKDGTKTQKAFKVGENLGKGAVKLKIKQVVFDRGAFKYHGRVSELAKGARKGGLEF